MSARFMARSEVDFIALALIVLGFQPENSLVMMTLNQFHARMDLPSDDEVDDCVAAMINPVKRHNVTQLAFVIFDGGNDHAALERALLGKFRDAGVEVVAALTARDGFYRRFIESEWKPMDIASNAMTLEAQYHNMPPRHSSREALQDYLKPCGEVITEAGALALRHLETFGLEDTITTLRRAEARKLVDVWANVMRSCDSDTELLPNIAIVVGFCAWLRGDGAMAWVALDQGDRTSTWHQLLTLALTQAVNPSTWPR